jgi:hypothetical protein
MSELDAKGLELRHQFLQERGAEGGSKAEFKEWLLGRVDVLREVYPNANQALVELASSIWQRKSKPENPRQGELRFAGEVLPYILRYRGEDGKHVAVLAEYGTVWQLARDLDGKRSNWDHVGEAFRRSQEIYDVALSRSGGDLFASLASLQDGLEDCLADSA